MYSPLRLGSALTAVAVVPALALTTHHSTATSPMTGPYPVMAAVGDMACDPADSAYNGGDGTALACAERRNSDAMLADTSLDGVLGLGDYQYDCGDLSDYAVSYTPTWGRLNDMMDPVAGNHEYKTGIDSYGATCPASNSTGANFFSYFANSHPDTHGHFSFDLGSWHLIGLNGNCGGGSVGGCYASGAQTQWLRADLAATAQPCVLAYWHQPLFTGLGPTGKKLTYKPWWNELYAAHADVVLNGHIHNYQRFLAVDPTGTADPLNGITEFIVGTGGEKQATFKSTVSPQPVAKAKTFGYLRLTLLPAGWTAEFVDFTGTVLDTSSGACHV